MNTAKVIRHPSADHKKPFPWIKTILVTGAAGAAYWLWRSSSTKTETALPIADPRSFLQQLAPGAEKYLPKASQHSLGVSGMEAQLYEQNAQLRERLAELNGFLKGQSVATSNTGILGDEE